MKFLKEKDGFFYTNSEVDLICPANYDNKTHAVPLLTELDGVLSKILGVFYIKQKTSIYSLAIPFYLHDIPFIDKKVSEDFEGNSFYIYTLAANTKMFGKKFVQSLDIAIEINNKFSSGNIVGIPYEDQPTFVANLFEAQINAKNVVHRSVGEAFVRTMSRNAANIDQCFSETYNNNSTMGRPIILDIEKINRTSNSDLSSIVTWNKKALVHMYDKTEKGRLPPMNKAIDLMTDPGNQFLTKSKKGK